MQITQDVRDYAAQRGVDASSALQMGMEEKAEEFKRRGATIYHENAAEGSAPEGASLKAAAKD